MNEPVNMNIDFFGVAYAEPDSERLEDVLKRISAIPNDGSRNREVGISPVRLQLLSVAQRGWVEGDFVRIRMNQLPKKASLEGDLKPFVLQPNEGVGEETAFLYDPSLNVIAIQRNRFALSYTAIQEYINCFVNKGALVHILPLLRADTIRRLNKWRAFRKVQIAVARVEAVRAYKKRKMAIGETVSIMEKFNAPTIELSLSMGHQEGAFDKRGALETFKGLWEAAGDVTGLTKVRISGINELGEKDVLDLIEERLWDSRSVTTDRRRTLPYQQRQNELRESFVGKTPEMRILRVAPGEQSAE